MIPPHVAAYAAGLRAAGGPEPGWSWGRVARFVELAGLGQWPARELGRAAYAWTSANLTPDARDYLRVLHPPARRSSAKKGAPKSGR